MNALRTQFTWTHYRALIRLENEDKREFYIAEASKNNWSARQLERQVNSRMKKKIVSIYKVHIPELSYKFSHCNVSKWWS